MCSPKSMTESWNAAPSHSQSNTGLSQSHGEVGTSLRRPEALRTAELSMECSESVPVYTGPMHDTSSVGVREGCSVWSVVAVGANRRSDERLVETEEVSGDLVKPALVGGERPLQGHAECQPTSLAVSEVETSAHLHSPVPLVALTPSALLPAFLSQDSTIVEPSLAFDGPVSKPGTSLSHLLSLEGCW